MNPFRSFREYEKFVYSIQQRFPSVKSSSLIVIRRHHIKHNRIPAPQMSFTRPNLLELIHEVEKFIKTVEGDE